MITIRKPLKHLPLFLVVNYEQMLKGDFKDKCNVIILDSLEAEELIEQLSRDMDKSRRFHYWIAFHNSIEGIDAMGRLIEFMIDNKFKFWVTAEQMKMYSQTLEEVQSKIDFPIEQV